MMRFVPVRFDDRPAEGFDTQLGAGVLFWMTLTALAIIAALV
jgi:hypothetical protein